MVCVCVGFCVRVCACVRGCAWYSANWYDTEDLRGLCVLLFSSSQACTLFCGLLGGVAGVVFLLTCRAPGVLFGVLFPSVYACQYEPS